MLCPGRHCQQLDSNCEFAFRTHALCHLVVSPKCHVWGCGDEHARAPDPEVLEPSDIESSAGRGWTRPFLQISHRMAQALLREHSWARLNKLENQVKSLNALLRKGV